MSAVAEVAVTSPVAAPARVVAAPVPRARFTPPPTVPRAYRERRPLGDPTPLVCTVARTALTVALGGEGIDQLVRWITPDLRSDLLLQRSLSRRARYAPLGGAHVIRVRLCRVSATAVEAGVVATEGEKLHAIAMRLEECAGRWLVTAMDVG